MGKTVSTFGIKHWMIWPAALVFYVIVTMIINTGLIFIIFLVEQKAQYRSINYAHFIYGEREAEMGGMPSLMSHFSLLSALEIKSVFQILVQPGDARSPDGVFWVLMTASMTFPLQHFQKLEETTSGPALTHFSWRSHWKSSTWYGFSPGELVECLMAVSRASPAFWMIYRPSKNMISILKLISGLFFYSCMPYATAQAQTNTCIFFFHVSLCCDSFDTHYSNHTFYFKIHFVFAASSLFPCLFSLNLLCMLRCVFCNTSPAGFMFIPRPWEGGSMELLFSVHWYYPRHLSKIVWHLVHHLYSTQHHWPWHKHYRFCWVCVMMARPLGSLLPWRE